MPPKPWPPWKAFGKDITRITFTAESKVKEIGVRKVLGAGVPHIVALLSKDFVVLVLVAAAITFPE